MKNIFICALLVCFASCKKESRDTPYNAGTGVSGPIDANELKEESPEEVSYWTLENLADAIQENRLATDYSDLSIEEDIMLFGEGTIERRVQILNGGTENEVIVSFENGEPFEMLYGNRGHWRTKHPIYIGLPVEKLNDLNGTAVSFAGFGWDYSGLVRFNDGNIDSNKYSVFVIPNYIDIDKEAAFEFMGSTFFESDASNVEKLHLYVSSITYKF